MKIVKMSASVIAPVLELLLNNCLISGVFPSSLKMGKIVPIHKKGQKNESCNYRPIALPSPLSRIFEKCIYEQMYPCFEKFNLLHTNMDLDKTAQLRKQCDNFMIIIIIFWKF